MRVLCVGEMLVDILAASVDEVSFQNDTKPVEQIRITSGGDANNNAINLAKLGHQVTYMGRVGRDSMADLVIKLARETGICMEYVRRSETADQTRSLILINSRGDRTFLQYPGVSAEFCLDDCDLSLLEQVDLLQIGGAFHLPHFDGAGSAALLKTAKEKNVITSMDVTSDRTGRWRGILDPCYPYLDYFLPSVEQASMMTGTTDPQQIAQFFLSQGVGHVAVKLGSKGAYYSDGFTSFYMGVYRGLRIADTTGAGDAFCAGFLTGVGEGRSPEACMALGTACSAFAISQVGATAGTVDRATLQAFIDDRPPLEIQRR